ncbi:MAG: hypothetical protein RMY36_019935, partial [Nostoc sp. SerVER01]
GGIENLGGTSTNVQMLIRLSFHVKLTPMARCPPHYRFIFFEDANSNIFSLASSFAPLLSNCFNQ